MYCRHYKPILSLCLPPCANSRDFSLSYYNHGQKNRGRFEIKQKGLLLYQSNSPYLVRVLRFELRASWTPFKRDTKLRHTRKCAVFVSPCIIAYLFSDCKHNFKNFENYLSLTAYSVSAKIKSSTSPLGSRRSFSWSCCCISILLSITTPLILCWVERK